MNVLARIPALFQDQDIAFSFTAPAAGDTALLVYDFTVSEALFGLTEVDVQLASDDPNVDLHALLDTPATLTIHHKYLGLRHYAGVIAQISRGEEGFHRTLYSITLLPMLHRLAHGSDCRIFQQKSVPDIIKELLKEHGIEDVKWSLTGSHEAREYCVQCRESHLDFIERCAAEEGIWYYFTYGENGQHTLHFIDNPEIVAELEVQSSLEYNAMPSGAVKGVFCNRFSLKEQLRSTSYTQRDYTFKNPPYSQQHKVDRQEDNGSAKDYALYDYPGRYKQDAAGKPFTKYRQEAVRVDATTGQGRTNAIHLSPGFKMALTDHPNDACNTAWHLLTVSHHGSQPQALGEEAGGGPATYSASFTAMPARLPYRPSRPAKPLVDGPQIAHVTGPDGEEIYCDEYGRVKVWFPWDRHGEKNDKSSCWIRVASNWAGPKWGHIAIPRIGQEVIVDFLEGDPDQPIITGRTYHAQNMPPYKLPDHKTRMSIKSDTHKGVGYNELRFEDEANREEIFVHAQKDMNIEVLNDRSKRVERDQSEVVGNDKSIEVGGDHDEVVSGNVSIAVGKNPLTSTLMEKTKVAFSKAGEIMEKMKIPDPFNFGKGNMQVFIEKNKSEVVNVASSEIVGVVKSVVAGQSFQTTVGKAMSTIVRGRKDIDVGQVMNIRVGDQFTIKVGENSVLTMSKEGDILIQGKRIKFKADTIDQN